MAKSEERIKARKLRRRGKSLLSISRELKVSKGSVSLWCQDIELTLQQVEKLRENRIRSGMKGRMMGAQANREKKLRAIEEGKEKAHNLLNDLTKRERLSLLVGLYWGEGTKSGHRFQFVNSDPDIIYAVSWILRNELGVPKERLVPRIQINEIHRPRIKKVLRFWSELLDIPISQFGNPFFIKVKNKKVYENHDSYYGVVRLEIQAGSELKYLTMGLIEEVKNQMLPV